MIEPPDSWYVAPSPGRALRVYLLGTLPFEAFLAFQRRLVYEVAGEPGDGALILCDHPPGITVGREGSRAHIRLGPEELRGREWPVRWVSRGGGGLLHVEGQVCAYPILRLDNINITPAAYVDALNTLTADLLNRYSIAAETTTGEPGVRVGQRRIAHVGVAVRGGVTSFGVVVNVNPDLDLFSAVHCDGHPLPMTAAVRETPHRVRPQSVRQQFADAVAARFGFARIAVFHTHPALVIGPANHHAHTARR